MAEGLRIAGEQATARVPVARPDETAGEVRDALPETSYDCADDVAVLDGSRLVGIVPIEVLMAAAPDEPARRLDGHGPTRRDSHCRPGEPWRGRWSARTSRASPW